MRRAFIILIALLLMAGIIQAQSFDFDKVYEKAKNYTVSVNIVIEVSYGTQTTEAKSRNIGTIVSPDGLVIFDATPISDDDPFSAMSGISVSAEPKSIEIKMMDGTTYQAEFIGIDRFTKIGFCKIKAEGLYSPYQR